MTNILNGQNLVMKLSQQNLWPGRGGGGKEGYSMPETTSAKTCKMKTIVVESVTYIAHISITNL